MPETIREVVAVFDDAETLDTAVYTLETRGFDRAAFSLLASEEAVAQKLGHRYQQVKEVEDDPKVPRETFFSRISRLEAEYLPAPALASIGALILAGVGTGLPALIAASGGALIGAALGRLIHQRHARRVQEQLARGGLVLWVNVRDAREEKTALEVLRAHSAHDVHAHKIAA
ncbi:MAG: hypothetical protein WA446_05950 [Steroidobacteraceae bacterium]